MDDIETTNDKKIQIESPTEFSIEHYAGKVVYDNTKMIEQNKDSCSTEFMKLMKSSTDRVVKELFSSIFFQPENTLTSECSEELADTSDATCKNYCTKKKLSAASSFRNNCWNLMQNLSIEKSGFHFVRCKRTNYHGDEEDDFDVQLILRQMRALDIVNTTLNIQQGYTHNIQYDEFFRRSINQSINNRQYQTTSFLFHS